MIMKNCILLKLSVVLFVLFVSSKIAIAQPNGSSHKIIDFKNLKATSVVLALDNSRQIIIDFYGENIFRLFADSATKDLRNPTAIPAAQILVDEPRKSVAMVMLNDEGKSISIATKKVKISFAKNTSAFTITNLQTGKVVAETVGSFLFEPSKVSLQLKENPTEYFYGGGVQNGRFSHKGKIIAIENQNSWTDGGVASPCPFYWSTNGYAIMWHSFQKGKYDFGATKKGITNIYHETNYADLFFMVDDGAVALLNDFYQLTGNPVLIPKFGFYEGHLNAYNRDYWKQDSAGILFENGEKYKESQKDNGGIKESLNGELKNNYQFSARAVIDRYKNSDMPLGWILPNDGYGAGYGQTSTLDSNILNLKNFGDYARQNGVEIGLWTQSDLHPKPGISALLQRDILKEVRDAGVRVLKTDVAWVGAGYSFGLNGVADVAQITPKYGNNARPFIISLDGWAGTQRYAGIWSGDQTGGEWEYIRFHIPTYIGSGLSGQPNITSDMDGIFGGKNTPVNIRDFQWKTFTPMQLNMDGWGSNPKYPQALGEPATSINRNYLKLKSELLPYTYSIAKSAVNGLPIIRAMFLQEQNAYTFGAATKYQYMFGPYFLIAPVYQNTNADKEGNDKRNGIYLPNGIWIDYFTGQQYEGNCVLNCFDAPLWKLPVFIKPGAIIPMVNANNNISQINNDIRIYELYPYGNESFTEYDDDGITEDYKTGNAVTTLIHSGVTNNIATIKIHPSIGNYKGFVAQKATLLKVNISQQPGAIDVHIGGKKIKLIKAVSKAAFNNFDNCYYYDSAPNLNRFATSGSSFAKIKIIKNPQLLIKLQKTDISKNAIELSIKNYVFNIKNNNKKTTGALIAPADVKISDKNTGAFSLQPSWKPVANADFYEVEFNNILYTHITDTTFLFDDLSAETDYSFKLRAANKSGYSNWSSVKGHTKENPLLYAIKGIVGNCSASAEEGAETYKLFDFDDGTDWHTTYQKKAIPFSIEMDLKGVYQLDKMQYRPRISGRNGIITKASLYYSNDKTNWVLSDSVQWNKDNTIKEFIFSNRPTARYIKLKATEAVGNYGTGREIYVFKVPGSAGYIPGDINSDGKIDRNDFTSYMNYTGLRKGDGDFEGYISNGDINKNNLIDAFDISNVATQLDGGVSSDSIATLNGTIILMPNKTTYKAGETVEIIVKGQNLSSVNALSFALPYNQQNYEFVGISSIQTKQMENLTYDRLHTSGSKALYPTFINIGNKEALNGNVELFIIKFKTKKEIHFNLKYTDGILVDKNLETRAL